VLPPDLELTLLLHWRFLTDAATRGGMLHSMQQPAPTQPSPAASSFAGFLAALTTPERDEPDRAPAWIDEELGEDVATLSYEQALRTHARNKPDSRWDWNAAAPPETAEKRATPRAAEPAQDNQPPRMDTAADRDLRSASVTIRLSQAECKRLHERAAEAGLTVSAYLRSCTFEVEPLRAQVKDTLAELRAAEADKAGATKRPARNSLFAWVMQWFRFPARNFSQQAAGRA